jgi:hypothetical protein
MPVIAPVNSFIQGLRQKAEDLEARRKRRTREFHRSETVMTSMIGSASLALALVVLAVTLAGITGVAWQPWTERRDMLTEKVPRVILSRHDFATNTWIREPEMIVARTIYSPAQHCRVLACLALGLGFIGLLCGWRRRQFSWLSTLGVSLAFLSIVLVLVFDVLTELHI